MEETAHEVRPADALAAWQQALAEVPQTPALSGALLRRRDDLFGRFAAWYGRLRSRPRAERRRWQRQLGLSLAGIALLLAVNGAPAGAVGPAATITVTDSTGTVANNGACSLPEAIINANADDQSGSTDCAAGSGADTISLSTNVTLTAVNNATNGNNGLPVVTSAITVEGNGQTISRASGSPNFRILAVGSGGNLTLNSATISGGIASGTFPANIGGGVYFGLYASGTVSHSTFSGNSAYSGGGIATRVSTVTVSNSTLSGNAVDRSGGGIYANFGSTLITNSTLSGNTVGFYGGGILAFAGTVTVTNCTLSGNSALTGGGIRGESTTMTVQNSTLSGNSVSTGGGMAFRSASATVQNSTLSGNLANSQGGGIDSSFSTVTVQNSTLSGNSAAFAGGINSAFSTVTMHNSIVALQAAGSDCTGNTLPTSGGYNIESGTSCNFTQASDLRNVTSASLALQPLANNGGPTQTRALAANSVAVDRIPAGALEANGCVAGTSTDQRNAPRAGGAGNGGSACDVGAYEYASTPLAVTLASFAAQAMVDHIQLNWETVSEANNAGFNLYRSASPAAPDALLAFVPSQAPGSTQGASYSFDDTEVTPGQTWYYWLEDVDLNGATSLHGPVSATLQAPTAVTLDALEAEAAAPGSVTTWGALAAALIAAAGVLGVRRRSRAH